jgi:hypothetical protein
MASDRIHGSQLVLMQGIGFVERIDDILAILRETCCGPEWRDPELQDDTRRHIYEALKLGLRDARDVLGFLTLRHSIGVGFWTLPKVSRLLKDETVPHGQRAFHLMLRTSNAYWNAARRICAQRVSGSHA